ncbi:hypothetical protein [Chitinophaga sp. Cy-1792]|uniref:hypothetical protein n=1 Tax=Chitinophaga sp. Cy-1792 TaxID=2608339 RepID=UPI00141E5C29|nr:hypothetical protein [Chitinophaga sp. Cy-1792]NIG52913.1 hypothetical protein [Chitinophaga sp. Cy-1792]
MKQFSKIWFLVVVMLISITPHIFAQEDDAEKLKSLQVAFLASKLNLTPQEAQQFWPVYNNYRSEIDQLLADKARNKNIDAKMDHASDADAVARNSMDKDLNFDKRYLDIKTKYTAEFQRVLPARKAGQVFNSEKEFRHLVISRLSSNAQQQQRINRLNQQQMRTGRH